MPLDLDDVLANFGEADQARMIVDEVTADRLTLPDPKPGNPDCAALSERDGCAPCDRRDGGCRLGEDPQPVLVPVSVPLLRTTRGVAARKAAGENIGFVIHGPDEVYDFS